jgi:hypothetical protein
MATCFHFIVCESLHKWQEIESFLIQEDKDDLLLYFTQEATYRNYAHILGHSAIWILSAMFQHELLALGTSKQAAT